MRLAKSMGATIVSPTVAIYTFELYPSRYNMTFAERATDLTGGFVLGAQRYGLKVFPELHPRADELLWTTRTDEEFERNLLVSGAGATHYDAPNGSTYRPPYYNALTVDVVEWYRNMIGELADQYKDYLSFAGVQLRVSNWQNPALNNLVSLDWGYDVDTVTRFFQDTGRTMPKEMLTGKEPAAARNRHDVILANFREAWINWRCERIRDIFRGIVQRVRQARSDLTVQVLFFALAGGEQPNSEDLREAGIDLDMLKSVEGLVLIDGRFQHGAKEDSIEWQRRTREEYLGANGVSLFEGEKGRASTLFPMHYIEITDAVAKSAQLGWANDRKDPWVSASSEPPGRLRLSRYAELVGDFDVYMLGDGGNGYVFSGEGLAEFMAEFRALPRRPFERVPNVGKTLVLRRSGKLFYIVSLSPKPQSVRINLAGAGDVRRVTTGELVARRDGEIAVDLKPYELNVFEATKPIDGLSIAQP